MIDIKEMKVLIADDMPDMFKSLRSMMRVLEYGSEYRYAASGIEALEALTEESFDLALLDNNMPGKEGLEVLDHVRTNPELQDMPVVMITGCATQGIVANAAESDIDAYMLKPLTTALLQEKIPPIIKKANNPSPMMNHLKKARLHEVQGNIEEAINEATKATRANTTSTRPMRDLAMYLLVKGMTEEARNYLQMAIDTNPMDVIALDRMAKLHLDLGELQEAFDYFEKAVEISPRNARRLLGLGRILVKMNQMDRAILMFEEAYESTADRSPIMEQAADICIEEGVVDYPTKVLKRLVQQENTRGDLMGKLGGLMVREGRAKEAITYLTKAESLEDEDVQIKIYLAKAYIAQKQGDRAKRRLRAALKIDPENDEARELMKKCR